MLRPMSYSESDVRIKYYNVVYKIQSSRIVSQCVLTPQLLDCHCQ